MNKMIDFRSDTVTLPSDEMRRAILSAKLGDDVFGEDPTVNELEEKAAKIMGKEWPELHDVFYYAGPNSDYLSLEDEEGESIEIQGSGRRRKPL